MQDQSPRQSAQDFGPIQEAAYTVRRRVNALLDALGANPQDAKIILQERDALAETIAQLAPVFSD